METTLTGVRSAPAPSNRSIVIAAAASCFGWALDLFDLFILLYVAPVIGRLFFPSDHPTVSLAGVYASFAVTLLMRPIGSAVFGAYADRNGRKRAMQVAVFGVGISTAVFGALPTVAQVGVIAPIIFVALRLVQGVFVGGVVASSHTIGTESVPPHWRGAVSGLVGGGGAGIGGLIASIVFFVASALFPGHLFEVWGWRVMFFSGLLTSLIGALLFTKLEESPFWKEQHARKAARRAEAATQVSPLRTLFSPPHRRVMMVNVILTATSGAGYYLCSGYMPTFFKVVKHLPNSTTSTILMATGLLSMVAAVAIGALSDRVGRRPVLIGAGILRLLLLPVLYLLMTHANSIASLAGYALLLSVLGGASYAPLLIFLNERFPTSIRATGTGLSWNIGFALGGMMPTFVSLFTRDVQQLPVTLSGFLFVVSALFLLGAFIVPETRGNLDSARRANATSH
ncbi:MAG TPA: MFS transporter [Paraburkholderia sp.]|jgi:MFS family permease